MNRKVLKSFLFIPFAAVLSAFALHVMKVKVPFGADDWIYLTLLMPFLEELFFRKFLYAIMLKIELVASRVLVWNAAVFGIYHFLGMMSLPREYLPFVILQVLGAIGVGYWFAWARKNTDSVLPSIFMHSAFNAIFLFTTLKLAS